jgi:hypothetical protein
LRNAMLHWLNLEAHRPVTPIEIVNRPMASRDRLKWSP